MHRRNVVVLVVSFVIVACGGGSASAQEPTGELDVAPTVRLDPQGESRGSVLLIHGGAWSSHGAGAVDAIRPAASRMVRRGYTAYLVDHHPGADGFDDVVMAYRTARNATPRHLPVCAWGESSGGHFALMLDARERLDCVMVAGAPTDLRHIARRFTEFRGYLQDLVNQLFALRPGGLRAWSPVRFARSMTANAALLYARQDMAIDPDQGRSLAARLRLRRGRLVLADRGAVPFVHGAIDQRSWNRFLTQERAVLRAASADRAAGR